MWLAGNAGVWSSVESGLQAMLGGGVWPAGNAGVWSVACKQCWGVECGLQAMLGCGVKGNISHRQVDGKNTLKEAVSCVSVTVL